MKMLRALLVVLALGSAAISTASARDSLSIGIHVGGYGHYAPPARYYPPPVVYTPYAYYGAPRVVYPHAYYHAPRASFSYRYDGGGHRYHGHGGRNHRWDGYGHRGHDRRGYR